MEAGPLWVEHLRPGMQIPLPPTACGENRVAAYADLVGAHHPVHLDDDFAKAAGFAGRIVHGPLPLGVSLAALGAAFGPALVSLLEVKSWSFIAPVFVQSEVRTEAHVLRIERSGGGATGTVEVEVRLIGDDGTLLQRGAVRLLVRRQSPGLLPSDSRGR